MHQHYQNKLTLQQEQKSSVKLDRRQKVKKKNILMVLFFGANL